MAFKIEKKPVDNTPQTFDEFQIPNMSGQSEVPIKHRADAPGADTPYVPMVLYNTDATPPTASDFPVGTIYIQYTA